MRRHETQGTGLLRWLNGLYTVLMYVLVFYVQYIHAHTRVDRPAWMLDRLSAYSWFGAGACSSMRALRVAPSSSCPLVVRVYSLAYNEIVASATIPFEM